MGSELSKHQALLEQPVHPPTPVQREQVITVITRAAQRSGGEDKLSEVLEMLGLTKDGAE
jgi:hypothetical protein